VVLPPTVTHHDTAQQCCAPALHRMPVPRCCTNTRALNSTTVWHHPKAGTTAQRGDAVLPWCPRGAKYSTAQCSKLTLPSARLHMWSRAYSSSHVLDVVHTRRAGCCCMVPPHCAVAQQCGCVVQCRVTMPNCQSTCRGFCVRTYRVAFGVDGWLGYAVRIVNAVSPA
jgi:hypothetical protein